MSTITFVYYLINLPYQELIKISSLVNVSSQIDLKSKNKGKDKWKEEEQKKKIYSFYLNSEFSPIYSALCYYLVRVLVAQEDLCLLLAAKTYLMVHFLVLLCSESSLCSQTLLIQIHLLLTESSLAESSLYFIKYIY